MALRTMTKAAYAKHRGCSRTAVYKALEWRIAGALLPDGKLDVALADCLWLANTNPLHPVTYRAARIAAEELSDRTDEQLASVLASQQELLEQMEEAIRLACGG